MIYCKDPSDEFLQASEEIRRFNIQTQHVFNEEIPHIQAMGKHCEILGEGLQTMAASMFTMFDPDHLTRPVGPVGTIWSAVFFAHSNFFAHVFLQHKFILQLKNMKVHMCYRKRKKTNWGFEELGI